MAGFHFGTGFWKRSAAFCPYIPGLYTEAEVDDLINIDGYIPVANAEEFDKIITGISETMGGCTKWGGTYTTGDDKKYIQVLAIDWLSYGTRTSNFSMDAGIYDGNNLSNTSLSSDRALFEFLLNGAQIKNVALQTTMSSALEQSTAGIVRVASEGTVSGCVVSGSISNTTTLADRGFGGICGSIQNTTGPVSILNCTNNATVNGASPSGGIVGFVANEANTILIDNCINNATITATSTQGFAGGICGRFENGTLQGCENYGDVTGRVGAGGITGRYSFTVTITESATYSCDVQTTEISSAARCGGIAGIGWTNAGTKNITKCKVDSCNIFNTSTNAFSSTGGVLGSNAVGFVTIEECAVINTTIDTDGSRCGGIAGYEQVGHIIITDCQVENCTISGTQYIGGIIGRAQNASTTINTSYSASSVTGTSNVGGVSGLSVGTINNTYWDTTIGPATSSGGTGQTTSALQTPTSNTGIYSAWTIPPWDFGTASDYPTLTTTP